MSAPLAALGLPSAHVKRRRRWHRQGGYASASRFIRPRVHWLRPVLDIFPRISPLPPGHIPPRLATPQTAVGSPWLLRKRLCQMRLHLQSWCRQWKRHVPCLLCKTDADDVAGPGYIGNFPTLLSSPPFNRSSFPSLPDGRPSLSFVRRLHFGRGVLPLISLRHSFIQARWPFTSQNRPGTFHRLDRLRLARHACQHLARATHLANGKQTEQDIALFARKGKTWLGP